MKYSIVYLLKGEAEKYHRELVEEVSQKFGVKGVVNSKVPSHVTLKYLSNRNEIKDIEELIKRISENINSFYLDVGGVGSFGKDVIFLKVKHSEELNKLEGELFGALRNFPDIKWDPWDKLPYAFHITLAEKDIGNKFYEIKKYCEDHEKHFRVLFDNITIIKKPKDKWIVHKEFKLK